jgi:hypothetical protein
MRVMMIVTVPNEPFNSLMREGKAGALIGRLLEEQKPEAVYFTERDGLRTAIVIAHVTKENDHVALAEPWWLAFGGKVELRLCMLPQDLASAGLEAIAARWA